jgi:hypothetical protein
MSRASRSNQIPRKIAPQFHGADIRLPGLTTPRSAAGGFDCGRGTEALRRGCRNPVELREIVFCNLTLACAVLS